MIIILVADDIFEAPSYIHSSYLIAWSSGLCVSGNDTGNNLPYTDILLGTDFVK